jgi:hypothetical protein
MGKRRFLCHPLPNSCLPDARKKEAASISLSPLSYIIPTLSIILTPQFMCLCFPASHPGTTIHSPHLIPVVPFRRRHGHRLPPRITGLQKLPEPLLAFLQRLARRRIGHVDHRPPQVERVRHVGTRAQEEQEDEVDRIPQHYFATSSNISVI